MPLRPDGYIPPCIPTRAVKPPAGRDWVHEVKHDGYRLQVRRQGETVRLFTRRGFDWTDRYPAIGVTAMLLRARSFTLDGEAVAGGPDGVAIFDALHRRGTVSEAMLYAFDLLELDGEDLRGMPLSDRTGCLTPRAPCSRCSTSEGGAPFASRTAYASAPTSPPPAAQKPQTNWAAFLHAHLHARRLAPSGRGATLWVTVRRVESHDEDCHCGGSHFVHRGPATTHRPCRGSPSSRGPPLGVIEAIEARERIGLHNLAGDHPREHLAGYAGIMPITEAACWSHGRRQFFDLATLSNARHILYSPRLAVANHRGDK